MRSAAIFVDAGYLFSGGSDLLFGESVKRSRLELREPQSLIERIMGTVNEWWDGDPLRLLRIYWYDGAVGGVPSAAQVAIGDLPRVKLRLGRLTHSGQKGVDGLIILDLITLARNRAVDVAVLISGDEDLRESALHAQSFGLTMIVAGFAATPRQGQSLLLLREADYVLPVPPEVLAPHLFLTTTVPALDIPVNEDAETPSTTTLSAPDASEAEESLVELCRGVVQDERFSGVSAILDISGIRPRLTQQADRVLIARLAELTRTFPVDRDLVVRARGICIDLIDQPGA